MYSPATSRRGFPTSSPSSASLSRSGSMSRKGAILSPATSGASPFSFSSETINVIDTDDGFNTNMSSTPRSSSFSQPRTPMDSAMNRSYCTAMGKSMSVGSGSYATPGRTVREYDETFRELKKENFNLKLRIYFLEERLGASRQRPGGGQEDLAKANTDLKIQVESLKYDINEKTELLREAGLALEELETKISTMAIEREDERQRLEARVRQLEEDAEEQNFLQLIKSDEEAIEDENEANLGSSSSSVNRDDDEKLLKEVDAEIARGLVTSTSSSGTMTKPTSLFLQSPSSANALPIVEEKDEAEAMAARLEEVETKAKELSRGYDDAVRRAEKTEEELQQRIKDMINLESQLVNRDIQLTSVRDELEQEKTAKSELIASHKEELELLGRAKKAAQEQLELLDDQNRALKHEISQRESVIEDLNSLLFKMKADAETMTEIFDSVDKSIAATQESNSFTASPDACPSLEDVSFSIHTHALADLADDSGITGGKHDLQVVVQHLDIAPDEAVNRSCELVRLRREVVKLRECLRRSDDERAILLRKIANLNEKLNEKGLDVPVSLSQIKKSPKGMVGSSLNNSRYLLIRVANLQQRLAHSCEDADLLRTHLEMLADTLEPLISKKMSSNNPAVSQELVDNIKRIVEESRQISMVSRVPTPLKLESTEERGLESDNSWRHDELPNPNLLVSDDEDLNPSRPGHQPGSSNHRARQLLNAVRNYTSGRKLSSGTVVNNAGQAVSEDEDSWSEPDVAAARKRMGLSAHMDNKGDKDSSETDLDKQKSFYSLTFTSAEDSKGDDDTKKASSSSFKGEDYSKIIEELQSHRKEIEKLHRASSSGGIDQASSSCNQQRPGSLECLTTSLASLSIVLNALQYEIDLSESIDSGNGTEEEEEEDEEDEETEAEEVSTDLVAFQPCNACERLLNKDVCMSLWRSGKMIQSASLTIRRLRKICSTLASRALTARQYQSQIRTMGIQLEETSRRLQEQKELVDELKQSLEESNDEAQESQRKLNENYKLVAELSNENLRLTAEKVRADEVVSDLRKTISELKNQLDEVMTPDGDKHDDDNEAPEAGCRGGRSSSFRSGSIDRAFDAQGRTHRPFQRKCVSCNASRNNNNSKNTHVYYNHPHHRQRSAHRAKHQYHGQSRRQQQQVQGGDASYKERTQHLQKSMSDISSPDLGVDVGSDNFSSLERRTRSSAAVLPDEVESDRVMLENHQLRRERDQLIEKLNRSKGALKETLDRLSRTSSVSRASSSDVLRPLPPPRRPLTTSASILSSVGGASSRQRVTQDLVEFSKFQGRSRRNHHRGAKQAKE